MPFAGVCAMSRRGLASDRPDPNAKGVYGKKLSYISGTGQSHVTFGGTRTMDAHAATCRKPWQGLFERLITEWDVRQSPEWDCAETRLPSAVYTDPQRYQAELNILFRAMPLCLGHEDQLDTSGAVLAREVAGLPLLVTRDSSGAVRVFLNACRHRGARLMPGEETVCRRSSLSCMVPWLDLRSRRTPAQRSATRSVPHAGRSRAWPAAAPVNGPAWPGLGDAEIPPALLVPTSRHISAASMRISQYSVLVGTGSFARTPWYGRPTGS